MSVLIRIKCGALESVLETDAFIMVECNSERRHLDIVADANGDGDHVDADGDDDTGGWLQGSRKFLIEKKFWLPRPDLSPRPQ